MTAKTTGLAVDRAEMSAKSTIIYNFAGILPNFQDRSVTDRLFIHDAWIFGGTF